MLIPLDMAPHIDEAYEAGGWILYALTHLWQRKWDPWADGWPTMFHEHRWPAQYGGAVWMDLRPTQQTVGQIHGVHLMWGAWQRHIELVLPKEGRVLMTGKAPDEDGISRDLNLDSDRRVYVLWGAGDPEQDSPRLVDIRRGWVRADPPGPEDAHGPAIAD